METHTRLEQSSFPLLKLHCEIKKHTEIRFLSYGEIDLSDESGFKILVTNQSNKDRIIRVAVAVVLVLGYFITPSSVNNTVVLIGLSVAGVLLFNAISGNCYIYQRLVSTLAHYQMFKTRFVFPLRRLPLLGRGQWAHLLLPFKTITIQCRSSYNACLVRGLTHHMPCI